MVYVRRINDAIESRDVLEKKMTQEQIGIAQKLTSNWLPSSIQIGQ
jgi:hypothetical protein